MPKKRRSKPSRSKTDSSRIRLLKEDDDGVYDEIDQYHNKYEEELLKLVKQPKPIAKEVLRVAVDDDELSDSELIDNEESTTIYASTTSNKWGKKRHNYYGTSYVDKDFGGVADSDEEEMLQLEEEDALERQRRIETANSCIDFDQFLSASNEGEEDRELAEILQMKPHNEEEEQMGNQADLEDIEEDAEDDDQSESEVDEQEVMGSAKDALGKKAPEPDSRDRRRVTYEILKNKGIRKDNGRRRKGKQHSRVMKRSQYEKALIRRRSQVPDLRRELTKYDGEKRGIRVSTVRSIKL